jgi:pyruvate/2-oxoglutarate dehydrogenase complex dihydrolipoamide dehydrogenase (E3) component/uncharacterized membrane protein YdjX (TVP38/TMEM64 family)
MKNTKRLALALLAAALVGGFFALNGHHWLTLQGLKAGLGQLMVYKDASPVWLGLAFGAVYVLSTALSLPGATVLTLAAGAIFGLVWGTVIASFAATLGATLAFWSARYVLRDWVQARLGARLQPINEGMARDGAFYLFTLRLVPVFPFFAINLLMGLVPIRTLTFYIVSQLGMLAATVVYVNAGTQLAHIDSVSGILSPGVMLSFVLLGVFPLLAKGMLGWLQRRRVYAKWKRPRNYDRNLVVLGAGAAGLVTAYIGAAVKAKVTLVEAHKMGGDCLNYGCVPSKALIKSAKLASQMRHADQYGLTAATPQFSFRHIMARVQAVIRAIAPHDSAERYEALGVEVLQGYGRVVDPWTVEIEAANGSKQRLTTRSIVIAAGAQPFVPALPGIAEVGYLTSDTLWDAFAQLDAPPARLVVLGGGPIGCELSQSFARLGSTVTQIEMGPRIMAREDAEISEIARTSLINDGVNVLTNHKAVRCEQEERDGMTHKYIVVEHAGTEQRIAFDALVCAVGRVARLQGYGLEDLGIPTQRTVVTNEYLETLYPNIYAAGDVSGPYQFTHVAAHQAWYAAVNALFGQFKRFKVDYSVIPWATFIDPEVARVGLNEQEAQEKGIAYEVTRYGIDDLDRAIADGCAQGFVKVLTVPGKDRILGVTIVGEHAADLLAEFVLAMKHGLGLNKILGTIHTYPTLAEANKYAAGEWKRAHAPERVLAWLKRYHAWRLHSR